MILWMCIDTKDKYRLPLFVTEDPHEMANHFHVHVNTVWSHYSKYKKTGKETRFLKVEVEDEDKQGESDA